MGRLVFTKTERSWLFYDAGKYSVRIITNAQAEVLASIAEDYGRNVIDITTRQAIQFHWLEIQQIPDIFKRLARVGLSSAGLVGDITRNITGNPLAGIDANELFDTTHIVKEYMITSNIMKSFLTCHVNLKCLLVLIFIIQQTQNYNERTRNRW